MPSLTDLIRSGRYLEALRLIATDTATRLALEASGSLRQVALYLAALASVAGHAAEATRLLAQLGVQPPEWLRALEELARAVKNLEPPSRIEALVRKLAPLAPMATRKLTALYIAEYLSKTRKLSESDAKALARLARVAELRPIAELLESKGLGEEVVRQLAGLLEKVASTPGAVILIPPNAPPGAVEEYQELLRQLKSIVEEYQRAPPEAMPQLLATAYGVVAQLERVLDTLEAPSDVKRAPLDLLKKMGYALIAKALDLMLKGEYEKAERMLEEAKPVLEKLGIPVPPARPLTLEEATCILRKMGVRLPEVLGVTTTVSPPRRGLPRALPT